MKVRIALALAASIAGAGGARAQDAEVRLTRGPDKAYEVTGLFTVAASTAAVWDVLADYERIPSFVSSMRSSRVRETRSDGALLVEQEAIGDAYFLSRTVRLLLEVRRSPAVMLFADVGLKDFSAYSGSWAAEATPMGARVTYRLRARPRFRAPSFILRGAMKRGARKLLDQVRAEILRRAHAR